MTETLAYGAVDLGASSGRVFRGSLTDGRLRLEEVARFPNTTVSLPDGLHWDASRLFADAVAALRGAGRLVSVGVDSWGVDYSLITERGARDGLPFHYRDPRTRVGVERVFDRIGPGELYAATGIQHMPINTVFQLMAEPADRLEGAQLLLISDLVAYWLSGKAANERTQASTTGLLDAHSGDWAEATITGLGLPRALFGPLIEPGTRLGAVWPSLGLGDAAVTAVAGHDTASAFVAAPLRDDRSAVLSSGTWSLLGVELSEPVLTEAARAANLSNERGIDQTIRLLRNVMGLWLEQECARAWGLAHAELHRLAEAADSAVAVFDPDHPSLLRAGYDMPERIAAACADLGQTPAPDYGALIRSIHLSLACKYRFVLEQLEAVTGREFDRIHIVGGGARVRLLCQLTAEITGCEVVAGPVEASAIGNVLVQARAAGDLGSVEEIRQVVVRSSALTTYLPEVSNRGEEQYQRFLELTGLRLALATPAP